jgi:predicted PhzF superfamily epimerase YddE/YHI9
MFVYSDEAAVRSLRPEFTVLVEQQVNVLVTAPGDTVDFMSRMFCPSVAEPEDPITGSAHCTSAPYWAQRLGRTRLTARQLSSRAPRVDCDVRGDRVVLSGRCVPYLEGHLTL